MSLFKRDIALKDTVELMTSENYKDRFKAEMLQLECRIKKLNDLVEKYGAGKLKFKPNCPYDLLKSQLVAMNMYYATLEKRAEIEHIFDEKAE